MNKDKQTTIYQAPPFDPELEQEIIGCLLVSPTSLDKTKETLGTITDKAFYHPKMKLIYKALLVMQEADIPISAATVYHFIKEHHTKIKLPASLLTDLTTKAIPESLLDHQLKKLKEYYHKRQLQQAGIILLQTIDDGTNPEEVKQIITDKLAKITITEEREKTITAKELLETELPENPYLIGKGLLPKQGYTMIVGKAKEGKTMLALNFALCLAEGVPVFMRETDKMGEFPVPHKAKTLFLFRENALQTLKNIISQQKKGLEALLDRKIKRETLDSIKLLRPKKVYLDIKQGQRELERIIKNNPAELIVIDPLSRFITKDMNKMDTIIKIANFLDNLGEKYSCAFLLLHHFRKLGAGDHAEEDPFERITGSAGLRNCMVSGLVMEKKSKKRSRNIKKLSFEFRNEESPEPISFIRDSETLLFKPITEEEVSEGVSSVSKLVDFMKKEFKNGVRYGKLADYASKKFGVAKQRIAELLRKGQKQGLISKEKGKQGKYFVLSQQSELPLNK